MTATTSSALASLSAPLPPAAAGSAAPQYSLLQAHSAAPVTSALSQLHPTVSPTFALKTRLTLSLSDPAQQHALSPSSAALLSYDLVAVAPGSEKLLHAALSSDAVDIVSFDLAQRLPFPLRITPVKMALAAGVVFELAYSAALTDAAARRQFVANVLQLCFMTRGRNLILTSAAAAALALRGPGDAVALAVLLGVPEVHARAAVGERCRMTVSKAAARAAVRGTMRVVLPPDAMLVDMTGTATGPHAHATALDANNGGNAPSSETSNWGHHKNRENSGDNRGDKKGEHRDQQGQNKNSNNIYKRDGGHQQGGDHKRSKKAY